MTIEELQHAIGTLADGKWGPNSRRALELALTNRQAPATSDQHLQKLAGELGCTLAQLRAVAAVESSGGGFDKQGRPKILYERHLFHRLTAGRFGITAWSNPAGGGYAQSSWDKLLTAAGKDPDAALGACSWGKFQVLGLHWRKLGYASALELARSMVESEAAHYELFARYIRVFGLAPALARVSANPDDCRDFAQGYNGPAYRKFNYHTRIAEALA